MNKNQTLVIVYDGMLVGGIENYLINLVLFCRKMKYRVIWLSPKERLVADDFRDILLDGYVELIDVYHKHMTWFKYESVLFKDNENVTILSFTIFDYFRAEKFLMDQSSKALFHNIYMIPHFTGNPYYIERYFKGITSKIIHKYMTSVIQKMDDNNGIVFFSPQHIEPLNSNYKIHVTEPESKILAPYIEVKPFDYENAKLRSIRNTFNIITIGRFEFPHKGYIIGLVDAYAKLKPKYPQLSLTIIGYGADKQMLLDKIQSIDSKIQQDIRLLGQVSPLELEQYLKLSHLNVSVAGAVMDGAHFGIISLPARHYCYDCEVYGYLPESKGEILSHKQGQPVEEYITEVLNMDAESFIEYSKMSYDTFDTAASYAPEYILERKNKHSRQTLSRKDIFFAKVIFYMFQIKNKLYTLLGKKMEQGY